MTKTAKAKDLFAANPDMANSDFVKLLMTELGMSLAGARTYAHNCRKPESGVKAPKAPSERQLKIRLKVEKAMAKAKYGTKQKASKVSYTDIKDRKAELSIDEIATIKEANLARMKAVSAKLRPFRDRLDDVIRERSPGFDPELARLEIQDDERGVLESQGFVARPQMFD